MAALQGVLLTVVLFSKKENHTANRILTVAVFALSLELLTVVYLSKGWYYQFPHLMGITYPFPFLYGPLFYFYAKLVSKKEDRFRVRSLIHFLPALLVYCFVSPIFFYSGAEKILFIQNIVSNSYSSAFRYIEMILSVQGIIYTILTIKVVLEYDKRIRNAFSNIDRINLNWLKYLTFGLVIIWSIVALLVILNDVLKIDLAVNFLLNTALSIMIYAIGYKGLKQPEIFLGPVAEEFEPQQSEKYKRSGLSDEIANTIKQSLERVMVSEKLYLDNNLTLQKLAERLDVSNHNLSEVINSRLNLTYYDFINSHRVEEFKVRIADPENGKYNILSIAFDSGFKSKGTFNSIFKKYTGMTPSEYKARLNIPETLKEKR